MELSLGGVKLTFVVVVVRWVVLVRGEPCDCLPAEGGEYELLHELLNLPSVKVGGVLESRWRKLVDVVVCSLL